MLRAVPHFALKDSARSYELMEHTPRYFAGTSTRIHQPVQQGAAGFVAAIRISPLFPYAFTGLIFSAARVRMGPFLLGTFGGLLPRTALSVGIGAALAHFDPEESGGWWSLGVALGAAGLGMAAAVWFGKRLLDKKAETSAPPRG